MDLENPIHLPPGMKVEMVQIIPALPQSVSIISYPVARHLLSSETSFDFVQARMDGFSPAWTKKCTLYQRSQKGQLLLHDCASSPSSSGAPMFRVKSEDTPEGAKTTTIEIYGMNVGGPAGGGTFSSIRLPRRDVETGKIVDSGNANLGVYAIVLVDREQLTQEDTEILPLASPSHSYFPREQNIQGRHAMKYQIPPSGILPDDSALPLYVQEYSHFLARTLGTSHEIINISKDDEDQIGTLVYGFRLTDVPINSEATHRGLSSKDVIIGFDGDWIGENNFSLLNFLQNLKNFRSDRVVHKIDYIKSIAGDLDHLEWTSSLVRSQRCRINSYFELIKKP